MRNDILETRIASLEAALENVIGCFDTSGLPYTTGVVVEGEDTEAEVVNDTFYVLDRAMNVLWNETDWFGEEEEG